MEDECGTDNAAQQDQKQTRKEKCIFKDFIVMQQWEPNPIQAIQRRPLLLTV